MTTNFPQNDTPKIASLNIYSLKDPAQRNVYDIAQRQNKKILHNDIEIDEEVANLINWLAQQEGISPEIALKQAVATAVYLRDITTNQGGRLLIAHRNKSVTELFLP